MNHPNVWSQPSLASNEDTSRMADFLEERSGRPDQVQINRAVKEVLALQAGERLLDIGTGTGVISRMAAPDITPDGFVVGLDISPEFINVASQLTAVENLTAFIRYIVGNSEDLPFPDETFDAATAVRLLLHVNHPRDVVAEMVRIARPGGRVILADWDFETVAVDHSNRDLTRRLLNWRTDHHGGNNWSGRQLLGHACSTGLKNITSTTVVTIATGEEAALTQSLWRAAEVALQDGCISKEEHKTWIDELKERISNGCFFASIVYFIVKGWKF